MSIIQSIGMSTSISISTIPADITWNPSDKGSRVTLSTDNLTANVATGNPGAMVRATVGKSTGKWYWEVINSSYGGSVVGIANNVSSLETSPGGDTNSWGYYYVGSKTYGAGNAPYGGGYGFNAVIGVKLDMDNGTIEFIRDNVPQGVAFTGLTGTIYPAFGGDANSVTGTAKFATASLTYAVPADYAVLS